MTGGTVEIDRYTLFGWSDGAQLLWKDAKPGDKLVLEFDALPKGECEIQYTIGPDYGRALVDYDGQSNKIDGHFIGIISVLETRRVKISTSNTAPHRFTVTMIGDGDHPRRFGLDAIVPLKTPADAKSETP